VVEGRRGLDARFDARDYEEVSELAESFNRMMGYLKKSEEEGKEMEERLRQADKLASIGQLAAGVAHEINNPLSLILGYTKMLRKQYPAEGQAREDLDVVYNNAKVCKKIVDDLLNFSHQRKTRLVPTDIHAVVEAAVDSLGERLRSSGIAIVRQFEPSLPTLMADPEKLKRVFTNLLLNSIQAMETNGTITIKTAYDPKKQGIRMTFSDTGPGIPEGMRDKVFEPFFTTKPPGEGTGLGLAVSYGIVEEHGGEISVRSEEGAGAFFSLWFPLQENRT
jgi:two-component system NtrC family sensor kinase